LLVQLDLEQLEFEIMDPVLCLKRRAEIAAPLRIIRYNRLERRPCFGKGLASHQGFRPLGGLELLARLGERALNVEQSGLIVLLRRAQLRRRGLLL
jgi:hypothetical protein